MTIAPEMPKADQKIYSDEERSLINELSFPRHIAIIMDGNRRWAKKQKLSVMTGHWKGAETLSSIVRAAGELGVEVLTVFGFSTENWNRPAIEVHSLMKLLKMNLIKQRDVMVEVGVRLQIIGDISKLPKEVREALDEAIEVTRAGNKMDLVIALNYGARDEIVRATRRLIDDCMNHRISQDAVTEELIASYLDTGKWRDPDLLIRPSGESRVSNFLLWQISYAEIVLTDVLWPDFSEKDLLAAICEYQRRELRIGR